jgi:hypothetical protein
LPREPTTLDPEGMNLIDSLVFEMLADSGVTAAAGLTMKDGFRMVDIRQEPPFFDYQMMLT